MLSTNAFNIVAQIGLQARPVFIINIDTDKNRDTLDRFHKQLIDTALKAALQSQAIEHCPWMPSLLLADQTSGNRDGIPNDISSNLIKASKAFGDWLNSRGIDPEGISAELSASYEAASAALLPRYRQSQLMCHFDIANGFAELHPNADYQAMGPRAFFFIASRLLLQRLLNARNIKLPLVITSSYLECLDTDWRFALWRLILSASGPVIGTLSRYPLSDDVFKELAWVDWGFPREVRWLEARIVSGDVDFSETAFGDECGNGMCVPEFLKRYPD